MTPEQYEKVRGAAKAVADRGCLIWGMFESDGKMCALAAFCKSQNPPLNRNTGYVNICAEALGCSNEEVRAFIRGYDSYRDDCSGEYPEWFAAGARLREELNPQEP